MVKRKDKDKIAVPVPGAEIPSGVSCDETVCNLPVDEYHGMGGSYVIDPVTGKRTLVGANNHSPQLETEALNNEIE